MNNHRWSGNVSAARARGNGWLQSPLPPSRSHRRCGRCTVKSSQTRVTEYLLLLRFNDEVHKSEGVQEILDKIWTVQYQLPNVLCASTGAVSPMEAEDTDINQALKYLDNQIAEPLGFSHAAHFRFNNPGTLEHFLSHPTFTEVMATCVTDNCDQISSIAYEGLVHKDIGAVFRRDPEYSSGYDVVMLLCPNQTRSKAGGQDSDADEVQQFLRKLGTLAESSVAGGVQSSCGSVIKCDGLTGVSHVFMCRFTNIKDALVFLQTPLCQEVIACQDHIPLHLAQLGLVLIEPASQTQQNVRGR